MIHIDLFAGIGGFSLALDRVFYEEKIKHIFVENDDFCTEVLKKHWPEAEYWGDIREFITDTSSSRTWVEKQNSNTQGRKSSNRPKSKVVRQRNGQVDAEGATTSIVTGGFPCQPFSQAGVRKGTSDDRYLWPEMFRVISEARPDWVVAENVAGLLTIQNGMVFEQVCSDLEGEGYEVQPFIIPACAVGAPHRRDRVWIVANRKHKRPIQSEYEKQSRPKERIFARGDSNAPDTVSNRTRGAHGEEIRESVGGWQEQSIGKGSKIRSNVTNSSPQRWEENWIEVATRLCRMDDGLPRRMDRNPRLKALGNAIVPQVAEKIFEGIKHTNSKTL